MVRQRAGGNVGDGHGHAGQAEDPSHLHGVRPEMGQVDRLDVEEHPFADAPGEQGDGEQTQIAIHG